MTDIFAARQRLSTCTSSLALIAVLAMPAAALAQQAPAPATATAAQPQDSAAAATAPTQAQPPADDAQTQDIVVTGFRQSLQSALNVKKQATGVVDGINASGKDAMSDALMPSTTPIPCSASRAFRSSATAGKAGRSPCAASRAISAAPG